MKDTIVVLGSVNMDLVLRCERFPAPGETVHGGDFGSWPGGKGANQAVAAARLGGHVAFVGCVGDDSFANAASAALRSEGIDTSHLHGLAGIPTGVAVVTVDAQGRNMVVLSAGANGRVGPAQVDGASELIAQAALLVCQLEIPLPSVERAIALARNAGVPVLLNAAPSAQLPAALLAQVDLLVVNETEAAVMDPNCTDSGHAAARLRSHGPGRVVVTLGERGVQVADEEGELAAPAPSAHVVDTTGAGDTFVGALAVALVEGRPFRDAVAFAQRAAALSVGRPGAMPSMPWRHELA